MPRLATPTLPTGGGAVRGIGEQFQVATASGTATLSVPLGLTAGRAGFTPGLALAYDSGAGNGAFGLGWDVPVPAVGRRTDRGVPRYRDDDPAEPDTFVLTGADDLVPRLAPGPGGWRPVVRREAEYEVRTYRPRSDALSSRIESWIHRGTGERHWRVISRTNVTSSFGRTPASRVADPDDPRRVLRWLLDEVADDRGNLAVYEYAREDSAGLEEADTTAQPQRYLKRVRYGNDRPGQPGDWRFEVVLDYGDHDDGAPAPQPSRAWPARPDPITSGRGGFELTLRRRCRRVLVFHRFDELGATPCLVRSTDLTYRDDGVVSLLTGITRVGYRRRPDGEGYERATLPPVDLAYTLAPPVGPVRTLPSGSAPLAAGPTGHRWVDLDTEGLAGVLTTAPEGWRYARNLGDGRLAPSAPVAGVPSVRGAGTTLADIGGDAGLSLVTMAGPTPGYQRRGPDGGWEPFTPFPAAPALPLEHPGVHSVDLDGDGRPDLLIHDGNRLRWQRSLGYRGYAPEEHVACAPDDDGPRCVFADARQAVHFADLTGDGLPDLVSVDNGAVCFWPNLGHGRFGARRVLRGAPVFDSADRFDPRRVRLADVDGSGLADLLYLGVDEVRIWPNRAGRDLLPPRRIAIGALATATTVDLLDLLGTGTTCLVWTSTLPAEADRPVRFLELTGGVKPLLLEQVDNGLGGRTRLRYAASTRFAAADRAAGRPWVTSLPFPVHVVERVEVSDVVTGSRATTGYRYRHGHYDRRDREFRGFALVETVAEAPGPDETPPTLTRDWFHVGTATGPLVTRSLVAEYYDGDPEAPEQPSLVVPSGAEHALRGLPLRTEVYGLDGSDREAHPYTVTTHGYEARPLQPGVPGRADGTPAAPPAFSAHRVETLTAHYERRPDDPRISHEVALDVDDHGVAVRTATLGYPRRVPAQPEQATTRCLVTVVEVVHQVEPGGPHRLGTPVRTAAYELVGLSATGPLRPAALRAAFDRAQTLPFEAQTLPFDAAAPPGTPSRRLLRQARTEYLRDDLSGPLPVGQVGSRALADQSYAFAGPDGVFAGLAGGEDCAGLAAEGGYVRADGAWWVPSGRLRLDPDRFYLATAVTDPFGHTATVEYDRYTLQVVAALDAVGNRLVARPDYRTMAPDLVTDPNGNQTAVTTDLHGRVLTVALLTAGDSAAEPTMGFEYADAEFERHGRPVYTAVTRRETHGPGARRQENRTYYDGLGRVVLIKARTDPDPADLDGAPRWVASGRVSYDRTGQLAGKFEPAFSASPEYEPAAENGTADRVRYDALGRAVRVDHADGSYVRLHRDAWREELWDANDTVLDSAWRAARVGLAPTDPQARAAELAARHAATPTVGHLDPLGRSVLVVTDNGTAGRLEVRTELDLLGATRRIIDPRGNPTEESEYDALGRRVRHTGAETGATATVPDALGAPLRTRTARGLVLRGRRDGLRRLTHLFVDGPDGTRLVRRVIYGEAVPDGAARNLRGSAHRVYDTAGVATIDRLDPHGNPSASSRALLRDHTSPVDWSALAEVSDLDALAAVAAPLLADEVFAGRVSYDALSRPVHAVAPDSSEQRAAYTLAGPVGRLTLTLPGEDAPRVLVAAVEHHADGRRDRVEYGNGVVRGYRYEAAGRRLAGLSAVRTADGALLQDLRLTHDPVGHLVELTDSAQQTLFFRNAVVAPTQRFEYDPAGRLVTATGREHAGTGGPGPTDPDAAALPHPNDATAVRAYTEHYRYDEAGNLTERRHVADGGGWTRRTEYASDSNRLVGDGYAHDAHGNLTRLPHLPGLEWDHADRLERVDLGGGGAAFYRYDGAGNRVQAVVERPGGLVEERIYLEGFEMLRRRTRAASDQAGTVTAERTTLRVADDTGVVTVVETATDRAAALRFVLADQVASARLEIDETGALISLEEFHPFGTTAYRSGRSAAETSLKRYRFTGRERDAETGLNYHGARYYAPWLGRWTAPDPAGPVDGVNLYAYVNNDPVRWHDPGGTDAKPAPTSAPTQSVVGTNDYLFELPPALQPLTRTHTDAAGAELYAYLSGHRWSIDGRSVDVAGEMTWVEGADGGGHWYFAFGVLEEELTTVVAERSAVPAPSLAVSLIPVVGSGWEAAHSFSEGDWGWGLIYTGLAITDLFLIKAAITAGGKLLGKAGAKLAGDALVVHAEESGAASLYKSITFQITEAEYNAAKSVRTGAALAAETAGLPIKQLAPSLAPGALKGVETLTVWGHGVIAEQVASGAHAIDFGLYGRLSAEKLANVLFDAGFRGDSLILASCATGAPDVLGRIFAQSFKAEWLRLGGSVTVMAPQAKAFTNTEGLLQVVGHALGEGWSFF